MREHLFRAAIKGGHCCDVCGGVRATHGPTPAYVPQVGDRVRVVIEGELTTVDDDGYYIRANRGWKHIVRPDAITSIERLPDPLPTTPGSVVRFGSDHLRFLSRAGWLTEYGEKVQADFPATVVFDAGVTP